MSIWFSVESIELSVYYSIKHLYYMWKDLHTIIKRAIYGPSEQFMQFKPSIQVHIHVEE